MERHTLRAQLVCKPGRVGAEEIRVFKIAFNAKPREEMDNPNSTSECQSGNGLRPAMPSWLRDSGTT
mgnify:CR=1 FL=1